MRTQQLTEDQIDILRKYLATLKHPYQVTANDLVDAMASLGLTITIAQASRYRSEIIRQTGGVLRKHRILPQPVETIHPLSGMPVATGPEAPASGEPPLPVESVQGLVFLGSFRTPSQMEVIGVHGGNVSGFVELVPMSGHTKVNVYSTYTRHHRQHGDIYLGTNLIAVLYDPALIR